MNLRKVISSRFRRHGGGVDVAGDVNAVVAANVNEPGGSTSVSSKQTVVQRSGRRASSEAEQKTSGGTEEGKKIERTDLSAEELEQQEAEELPDREAMSLINANVAAPVNAAAALNVLSDDSAAVADAEQTADIDQSN
jgi:hypothetical protein